MLLLLLILLLILLGSPGQCQTSGVKAGDVLVQVDLTRVVDMPFEEVLETITEASKSKRMQLMFVSSVIIFLKII